MSTLNPRQRGSLVEALGSAVFHGGTAIGDVPTLLKQVLDSEAWREFETPTHEIVTYDHFEQFVKTPPTRGLGADIQLIRRIIADDPVTLDLLDRTLQNPAHVHLRRDADDDNNIQVNAPQGTSTARALRALRDKRPDLHTQVLAGEKSPHAAMVEAGFRHPTITVPKDDVDAIARRLRSNLTPDQLDALIQRLSDPTE